MKNKIVGSLFLIFLMVGTTFFTRSCGERNETVRCFPIVPINVVLNLSLPAYQNLQNVGGWLYINEQSSGTRGLIVVKTTTGFMIYDRNAPQLCPDTNTTLEVVDNLKIVCPKDGAEWILLTGQPTKVAAIPPKIYPYVYNPSSNSLTIYN